MFWKLKVYFVAYVLSIIDNNSLTVSQQSGSFSQMQNLRTRLMQGYKIPRSCRHNGGNVPDPLTVADLLKDLLRNLESSLLPKETGRQLLSTQQVLFQ